MKKMPSIFIRDWKKKPAVQDEINPECQWVFDGEGVATRKYDGTCALITNDGYFKRRTVRKGKPIPKGFIFVQEVNGKQIGWVPVTASDDRHLEGWRLRKEITLMGTYELCGPKIQSNLEGFEECVLIKHANIPPYHGLLRTFEGIKEFMRKKDIEGIVFHHQDGRMAKIKKSDYGMKRNYRETY